MTKCIAAVVQLFLRLWSSPQWLQSVRSYLHQSCKAASSEDMCGRGRPALTGATVAGATEEVQGSAVRAKGNGIDEASGKQWKGHAFEKSTELM